MSSHSNVWSELPFPPGSSHVLPQYWKGDFPHVFMGDGKEDFSKWCRRFEVSVEANPNSDEDSFVKLLPTRLGAAALSYWDSLPDTTQCDYTAVKEKLKAVFGHTAYLCTFQSDVNARTRLPAEALPVFAAEISRLVEEAFPTSGQNAKDGENLRRFIAGIEPYLQLRCHEHGVTTLDSALQFALQIESAHHASRVFHHQTLCHVFLRHLCHLLSLLWPPLTFLLLHLLSVSTLPPRRILGKCREHWRHFEKELSSCS